MFHNLTRNQDWAATLDRLRDASYGSACLSIERLQAENAELRRQLDAARECLRMTDTESSRRVRDHAAIVEAERDRYREVARCYLAALDRLHEQERAISEERWDAVTAAMWDEAAARQRAVGDRLADLRAAAKEDRCKT